MKTASDWTTKALADLATVSAGQGAPQNHSDFDESGTPFIRAGSLDALVNGGSEDDCERIPQRTARKYGLRLFPAETILFAKSGMSAKKGRVYKLRRPAYVTNHLAAIIPTDRAEPDYLFRWLSAFPPTHLIPNDSYPSIRLGEVEQLRITLPTTSKGQKRIAAILDKADAIRAGRREMLTQADSLLRAIFLETFGDPVTNPKGWPLRSFGSLGILERGRSMHRPRNDPALLGGPYPLVQTGDVSRADDVIETYTSTYSELGLKQSRLWPAGTLCITIAANIAETAVLGFDACFPDSVVGFTPGGDVTSEYIQNSLQMMRDHLAEKAPAVAQANINLRILRDLVLPVPPKALQANFQQIVRTHRSLRQTSKAALKDADILYASLAQRAFRGEL